MNAKHIKSFRLHNIGRFKSLELSLVQPTGKPARIVVFVGNNGAGKTSILKSLATSLGCFIARLRSEKSSGGNLKVESINNFENAASIEIEVQDEYRAEEQTATWCWKLTRTRPGSVGDESSNLSSAALLANRYRDKLNLALPVNFPLIAFYPVERSVIQAPLKARQKLQYPRLSGYEGLSEDSVNFSRFFEWFRDREDHENEVGASTSPNPELLQSVRAAQQAIVQDRTAYDEDYIHELQDLKKSLEALEKNILASAYTDRPTRQRSEDKQLNTVRSAIERFMPGFSNIRVKRRPTLQMLVDKDEQTLDILQLSQGEKSLMALIGDIARRLSILNPELENPLEGRGVVLIDEIDLHLHPKWQRSVVEQLTHTFPNCQFVLTTHSPLVISDSPDMLVFSLNDGEVSAVTPQYGQDANSVLLDVMDTPIRNINIEAELNDLFDAIQDKQLVKAKAMIARLEAILPATNLELNKARLMLRKQELRIEKDQ